DWSSDVCSSDLAQVEQDLLRGDAHQPRGREGQYRRADGGDDEQREGADERGEVAVDGGGYALIEGVGDEHRSDDEQDRGEDDDDGEEDDHGQVRPDQGHEQGTGLGRDVRWQLLDLVVAFESDGAHDRPPSRPDIWGCACAWACVSGCPCGRAWASATALAPMSSR